MRVVIGSLVVVVTLAVATAIVGRRLLVPESVSVKSTTPLPPPREPMPERKNMSDTTISQSDALERLWCEQGPQAVVQATLEMDQTKLDATSSEQRLMHAWLRCEALFALGQVAQASDLNKKMMEVVTNAPSPGECQLFFQEQHARLRIAGGETNMSKQEERLQTSIEARLLVGSSVPPEAWATLGTLQKVRGECAAAIESFSHCVDEMDAPAWAKLHHTAPWRLQILALAAMDRSDCYRTLGNETAARNSAIEIAASLAAALGEQDPLAQQAADMRDQVVADE